MSTVFTPIERAIYVTLCYHDIFACPLTPLEIWMFLYIEKELDPAFETVFEVLQTSSALRSRIESKNGYFFLKGKQSCVQLRNERYVISQRKFKRAKVVSRMLAALPFVRMIAICNSLGMNAASEESDIDFLIVVEKGYVWFVRFASLTLLHLLRLRPLQRGFLKDTVCLSFFLSTESLDVSSFALQPSKEFGDVYLAWWVIHCIPLYDGGNWHDAFFKANAWVRETHPTWQVARPSERRRVILPAVLNHIKSLAEEVCRLFGQNLDTVARHLQMRLLPSELRKLANSDTRVVLTKDVVKCHPTDRREEIREKLDVTISQTQ